MSGSDFENPSDVPPGIAAAPCGAEASTPREAIAVFVARHVCRLGPQAGFGFPFGSPSKQQEKGNPQQEGGDVMLEMPAMQAINHTHTCLFFGNFLLAL